VSRVKKSHIFSILRVFFGLEISSLVSELVGWLAKCLESFHRTLNLCEIKILLKIAFIRVPLL
jgi:hypothetical protein